MPPEYTYAFESEYGLKIGLIEGKNRRAVIEKLKDRYPDDIGSDGVITNENGDEFAINW